jgi:hypothetical protein
VIEAAPLDSFAPAAPVVDVLTGTDVDAPRGPGRSLDHKPRSPDRLISAP